MVGMARCAVPARVVAGGTNSPATLVIEGVAPLHAALTSQRDVPTALNRYSLAIHETEEPGADPVLKRELITDQPHPGESGHSIDTVIARPTGPVPHGHGNIDLLQPVQRLSHLSAVGNARGALHPVAHGHDMIVQVLRIDIILAVSRRRQALHQCRLVRAASPREPAKIARLNAVVNVLNHGPDLYAHQALLVQRNRVKIAPQPR